MLSLANLLFIFSNQYIPKYRPAMQIQVGWHSNITKQNFKYLFDDSFVIWKQKILGFLLASLTKFNSVSRRGVFRNFSNIFHGAFCVNAFVIAFCYWFLTVNSFRKKVPSKLFEKIRNILLPSLSCPKVMLWISTRHKFDM